MSRWHKIDTLHEKFHTQVEWDVLKPATQKPHSIQFRWASILASKELPTGKIMATRGSWSSPACPRDFENPAEDVPHIFQYHKGDETWDKLKNYS